MRRALAAVAAVVAAFAVTTPAHAATVPYVVSAAFLFTPGDVSVARGETLTLVNLDPAAHDVTALDVGPGGPLFRSATIDRPGQTAVVTGVESLEPGVYEFYCSVHTEMHGTVSVA
ncbi:MAG TPA: cupredoxin domain-containing protein [Mycobacteriales bacterium]|jgi:plastocyanin|nr:cupredoxin domain-containing protein [Mycobacteriales bacterium]